MRDFSHPISPFFMNAIATGMGRGGVGEDRLPYFQADIPCIFADISWGADLLCSPHFISTTLIIPQRGSHYLHCNTCVNDSSSYPHPLGNYGFGHIPLLFMTVHLGIFLYQYFRPYVSGVC